MEGLFQQSFAVDFIPPKGCGGRKVPSRTNNGNTPSSDGVDRRDRNRCTGSPPALRSTLLRDPELGSRRRRRAIIWGYDAFEIYETREDGLPDYEGGLVTHEFLRKLANYLESGEELDIQTAGYTKCRFPVLAKRYVVRDGEVLYADLSTLKTIEE